MPHTVNASQLAGEFPPIVFPAYASASDCDRFDAKLAVALQIRLARRQTNARNSCHAALITTVAAHTVPNIADKSPHAVAMPSRRTTTAPIYIWWVGIWSYNTQGFVLARAISTVFIYRSRALVSAALTICASSREHAVMVTIPAVSFRTVTWPSDPSMSNRDVFSRT